MCILKDVKNALDILPNITVYDNQLNLLIEDAKCELIGGGIPKEKIKEDNAQIKMCIILYVKMNFGQDRADTEKYKEMYERKLKRVIYTV